MFPSVLAPLAIAMALSVVVTTAHRRLPPVLAARSLAITVVAVVGAAAPTLLVVSLGFLAHVPLLGISAQWCAHVFDVHERVPVWIGVSSLALTVVGSLRAARLLRTHLRLRHDHPGSIEVAGHEQPFAFTLPGRGGHVVVSTGLVELLDDREQGVVLAHEGAHAQHRHDRYLLLGQLAAAYIPLLRPLVSRLQFSLERWADEIAANACGDRRLVAFTLGKVALHGSEPLGALRFAGLGVSARVAALLAPPIPEPRSPMAIVLWSVIAATGALAAFQIHHLARLVTLLFPG